MCACGHFTLDTSDIFSAARADASVRRNEHVRHCSILYYLEDGSIQVSACNQTTKFEQTPSHAIPPCATALKYCYPARISKVLLPGELHMHSTYFADARLDGVRWEKNDKTTAA